MPTLHVTGLRKSFGSHVIYDGVSFRLPPGERLALIGRNGAGKTTLLRTIVGEIDADAGDVGKPKGYRIALHDQRPPIAGAHTLGSYVGEGLADVHAAEDRLRELERRMSEGDGSDDVLRAYAHAQSELESVGGYAWRARFEEILRGLGFRVEDADRPLGSFSGGELTRASLARVLASQPDLLLLDEPTNHLDLRALEWLEDQLTALTCSILLVSHDRWFLERVATGVLELEFGRSKHYAMGYSSYRREKALALANQADAFERQQAEIARLQRFVDKFRAGTRSRQAQSKVKAMQRMPRVEAPRRDRALAFGFSKVERSGRIVVEAEKLTLRAGDKPLLDDAGLVVERGQRVAVIGPERRRQDDARRDAARPARCGQRPHQAGPQRHHGLLQPAHRRDARAPQRRRRDDARDQRAPQLDAVAHDPGQLPLQPGRGRPQGGRALGRRAAAARAGGARRRQRQPARARRAHEPPRRRGARGARGGARRLRGHGRCWSRTTAR